MIEKVFKECKDPLLAKQICFQIARQRINIPDLDQDCKAIAYNEKLSDFYIKFAKELEVVEAKSPDQVYKASLEIKVNLLNNNLSEIAIQNLANTYVNAFVNCGAKQDVYMLNHAGAQNDDQKLYLQQKKHLDCRKNFAFPSPQNSFWVASPLPLSGTLSGREQLGVEMAMEKGIPRKLSQVAPHAHPGV